MAPEPHGSQIPIEAAASHKICALLFLSVCFLAEGEFVLLILSSIGVEEFPVYAQSTKQGAFVCALPLDF